MGKIKIKRDDKVLVIAGEHKGSEGKVIKVIRDQNKAIIEGVNLIKKHAKPSAQNPQGGIIEKGNKTREGAKRKKEEEQKEKGMEDGQREGQGQEYKEDDNEEVADT